MHPIPTIYVNFAFWSLPSFLIFLDINVPLILKNKHTGIRIIINIMKRRFLYTVATRAKEKLILVMKE